MPQWIVGCGLKNEMNSTLEYIKKKYHLSYDISMPIILKRIGRHSGLKELFRELGFQTGAEIGTKEGNYAKELCKAIPDIKLYCIDPWKAYKDYQEDWVGNQKSMDALYEETKNRLSDYNCVIIRKKSSDAAKDFKKDTLDFVFIDGNHEFNFVLDDITKWAKVVTPGGIVFGHDYTEDHGGVIRAVHKYITKNKINPWFILHVRGQADCWMFVKAENQSGILYDTKQINLGS